ncbi:MAG TPA: M48 family metalloprotease [Rhodocyclaceae bacterium]|nr:M48 family metalloprotease [Rhodocyclaceae bacterium]
MRFFTRLMVGALALLTALPPLHASDLPELGDAAGDDFSLLTEKRIGHQIMRDIRWRDPSYLDDPEVELYLNQLGGRLAAASSDPAIGFYFFPLDRMINAFALPGGYIGVNSGLLLAAQSESEVAGVLAHEISHVTQRHIARQIFREKQMSVPAMLAMAVALLAARSNAQIASAAVATTQGAIIQNQLGFSRDFEREADRVGFDTLQKGGFDVRGMSNFFERLQKATRTLENNAPVYLRTHPLTTERISDMQNREQKVRYRQVPDTTEFQLVRAKLRAIDGKPYEAVKIYEELLKEKKYASEPATRYGMAVAYARAKNWEGAERELALVKKAKVVSPMVERMVAQVRIGQGDVAGGLAIYREAMSRYPLNTALVYAYGEALSDAARFDELYTFAEKELQNYPQDVRLYNFQAKAAAALGRRAQQHRSTAEAYALQGQTAAAIEQLQLAQRAGDANFYELSVIDARLRELKRRLEEELKEKRKGNGP